MPRTPRPRLSALALPAAILGLSLATPSLAAWAPNGNLVAPPGAASTSDFFQAAVDGASGLFVQFNGSPLMASRLLPNGTVAAGWPVNPVLPGSDFFSSPVPDGHGGVYFAGASPQNVRAFHLTGHGDLDPGWPVGGLLVCDIPCPRSIPSAAPDGEGGMYVAWVDARNLNPLIGNFPTELYVARVTLGGALAPGWTDGGNLFGAIPPSRPDTTHMSIGTVTSDEVGGAFVTAAYTVGGFDTGSYQHDDRFVQHVNPDGSRAAGWPVYGLEPADTLAGGFYAVVADHGGCFAAWLKESGGTNISRVHRFLSSGAPAPAWPANGVPASPDTTHSAYALALAADGSGGCYIAVTRDTAGGFAPARGAIRKLDSTGSPSFGWPADGIRIPAPPDTNYERTILLAPDLAGGVYGMWTLRDSSVPPSGAGALAALHLDASSAVVAGWPSAGLVVRDTTGYLNSPRLLADGRGAAYAVWNEHRGEGFFADVYATRLGSDGQSLTSVASTSLNGPLLAASPSPFVTRTTIRFALGVPSNVRLAVYDVTGRQVRRLVAGTLPAGAHASSWDGRDDHARPVSPGVYVIGGTIDGRPASAKVLRVQ